MNQLFAYNKDYYGEDEENVLVISPGPGIAAPENTHNSWTNTAILHDTLQTFFSFFCHLFLSSAP